jgi:hypothetical protein
MDKGLLASLINQHLRDQGRGDGLTNEETSRLLCASLGTRYLTSGLLIHIVRQLIREAHRLLRSDEKWRIRFVLDDWSTFKASYPEVRDDPLFLPFLTSLLRREGVTALFINTLPGSPSRILEESLDRDLRILMDNHMYTWHVPFYGERRVAISALPTGTFEGSSQVRELRPLRRPGNTPHRANRTIDSECLEVDPHFEIYSGLEREKEAPTLVPLRVFLFAETPECALHKDYLKRTMDVFQQLFHGHGGTAVVEVRYGIDYDILRELSYLQNEARLDYTLVLQVDEFWADTEERSELLPQEPYLEADTVNADGSPILAEDPMGVFRRSQTSDSARQMRRRDFFHCVSNDYGRYDKMYFVDKVPYTWDFGFLLCDYRAWRQAFGRKIHGQSGAGDTGNMEIEAIWNALSRPNQCGGARYSVSWRDFFNACLEVKRRTGNVHTLAFDVDLLAVETVSCLLLEIWASEIRRRTAKSFFPAGRHEGRRVSLVELLDLDDGRQALYDACLLLNEVVGQDQFSTKGFNIVPRAASQDAIAARHWFSTASVAVNKEGGSTLVPLGLPGSYSVRGDWFLAIARGSRSQRLGEHAIDLLSSRRGNIERLQSGLGLPVRDLPLGPEEHQELWTPLRSEETGRHGVPITYSELRELGAVDCTDNADGRGRENLNWIWRSTIWHYDLHARILQRWLCSLLRHWEKWPSPTSGEPNRFAEYDHRRAPNWRTSKRFDEFERFCKGLAATLRRAGYSKAKAPSFDYEKEAQ